MALIRNGNNVYIYTEKNDAGTFVNPVRPEFYKKYTADSPYLKNPDHAVGILTNEILDVVEEFPQRHMPPDEYLKLRKSCLTYIHKNNVVLLSASQTIPNPNPPPTDGTPHHRDYTSFMSLREVYVANILTQSKNDTKLLEKMRKISMELYILNHLKHPNIMETLNMSVHRRLARYQLIFTPHISMSSIMYRYYQQFPHANALFHLLSTPRYIGEEMLKGLWFLYHNRITHNAIDFDAVYISLTGEVRLGDFAKAKINNAKNAGQYDLAAFGAMFWMLFDRTLNWNTMDTGGRILNRREEKFNNVYNRIRRAFRPYLTPRSFQAKEYLRRPARVARAVRGNKSTLATFKRLFIILGGNYNRDHARLDLIYFNKAVRLPMFLEPIFNQPAYVHPKLNILDDWSYESLIEFTFTVTNNEVGATATKRFTVESSLPHRVLHMLHRVANDLYDIDGEHMHLLEPFDMLLLKEHYDVMLYHLERLLIIRTPPFDWDEIQRSELFYFDRGQVRKVWMMGRLVKCKGIEIEESPYDLSPIIDQPLFRDNVD